MTIKNIRLTDRDELLILDQTLLPGKEVVLCIETPQQMVEAIARLRVRGAPAIGIFAGMCLYKCACSLGGLPAEEFLQRLQSEGDMLCAARPTAVNLSWAVRRMLKLARREIGLPRQALLARLRAECLDIQQEDAACCRRMAELGLSLLHDGDGLLTHCNAGPLATSQYGTALGPMLLGLERGLRFRIFADETRPLLQGARLTAYELQSAGADVTLICDNMASAVMQRGWVQACFVGCDRVAANGDAANKIGTSGVAILARHYNIPFYVMCPRSTIDPACKTGADIRIEQREPAEITSLFFSAPIAPAGVKCYNPAFDVTDASLITAIITEDGIHYPPFHLV